VFTRLQLAVFALNHKLELDPGVADDAAIAESFQVRTRPAVRATHDEMHSR